MTDNLLRRLDLRNKKSTLLLGPRRVGKSTLLKTLGDENVIFIDLLKSDVYFEYQARPALIRERFEKQASLIVIDEIQLIPDLLREVHWLIENSKNKFVLSGSSARKLRRQGLTNLAGRLSSRYLHPLTSFEIPDFDLTRALQFGTLPPVYFSEEPFLELSDYCGEYLKEEIIAEGVVRNLPAFNRFLQVAAITNSEPISYSNIAKDCDVSPKTVESFFEILSDTLLGHLVEPWTKSKKRRALLQNRFYFFDCGIVNRLLDRTLSPKTREFGKMFEQFIFLETIAARDYERKFEKVSFWRSASGFEVDLIIDDHTAIEIKSGPVNENDLKGITALSEDMKLRNLWVVSTEKYTRRVGKNTYVLPWKDYLERIRTGHWLE